VRTSNPAATGDAGNRRGGCRGGKKGRGEDVINILSRMALQRHVERHPGDSVDDFPVPSPRERERERAFFRSNRTHGRFAPRNYAFDIIAR